MSFRKFEPKNLFDFEDAQASSSVGFIPYNNGLELDQSSQNFDDFDENQGSQNFLPFDGHQDYLDDDFDAGGFDSNSMYQGGFQNYENNLFDNNYYDEYDDYYDDYDDDYDDYEDLGDVYRYESSPIFLKDLVRYEDMDDFVSDLDHKLGKVWREINLLSRFTRGVYNNCPEPHKYFEDIKNPDHDYRRSQRRNQNWVQAPRERTEEEEDDFEFNPQLPNQNYYDNQDEQSNDDEELDFSYNAPENQNVQEDIRQEPIPNQQPINVNYQQQENNQPDSYLANIDFNLPWFYYDYTPNEIQAFENLINYVNRDQESRDNFTMLVSDSKLNPIAVGHSGNYNLDSFMPVNNNKMKSFENGVVYTKEMPNKKTIKFLQENRINTIITALTMEKYSKLLKRWKIDDFFERALSKGIAFYVVFVD